MEKVQKQWEEDSIRRWYYGNQRKVERNEEYRERQEVITSLRFGQTGLKTIQFNIGNPRNSESEEIRAVLKSLGATNLIERTYSFFVVKRYSHSDP